MSEQLKTNIDIGKIESDEIRSDEITDDFSRQMYEALMEKEARNSTIETTELNDEMPDGITNGDADFSKARWEAQAAADAKEVAEAKYVTPEVSYGYEFKGNNAEIDKSKNIQTKLGKFVLKMFRGFNDEARTNIEKVVKSAEDIAKDEKDFTRLIARAIDINVDPRPVIEKFSLENMVKDFERIIHRKLNEI